MGVRSAPSKHTEYLSAGEKDVFLGASASSGLEVSDDEEQRGRLFHPKWVGWDRTPRSSSLNVPVLSPV